MCRHLLYLGRPVTLAEVLTDPQHSLYRQSWAPRRQRYGTVNADGFGVGWYPPGDPHRPARYRRAVPIWADANLPDLARTVRSGAVLAAVRCATADTSLAEGAAAPLRDGRWLFSHNGAIQDWRNLPAEADLGLEAADLLSLESASDTALLWAALGVRLRRGEPAGQALGALVAQVARVRPQARLTTLLTDGRTVAATRHGDTLWYRHDPHGLLIASEPHDDDQDSGGDVGEWIEIPEHSLVHADPTGITITPLSTGTPGPLPTIPAASPRSSATTAAQGEAGEPASRFSLVDRLPADYFTAALRADVLAGLSAPPRSLPPKWFYDARGSELFEQITHLPEYYPTRTEQQILTDRAGQIAEATRARALVELGSGSSRKTRTLLDALDAAGTLALYAPLDVSATALTHAGHALCRDYPDLRVAATVTDFEADLTPPAGNHPRLIAFLGGTIGNLDTAERAQFFGRLRAALGEQDAFLLGADLVKDAETLVRAYDDSQGVTAAFNKNVLHVLNRELEADFDADAFEHHAVWNSEQERIEMWLRSPAAQTVKIRALDLTLELDHGEEIRTEISVKFRRDSLTDELANAGFHIRHWWTDPAENYALILAVPASA
jgi:dimethylhistidine N-methyltransferase/ergothioneine biosynthesis protein EgtC